MPLWLLLIQWLGENSTSKPSNKRKILIPTITIMIDIVKVIVMGMRQRALQGRVPKYDARCLIVMLSGSLTVQISLNLEKSCSRYKKRRSLITVLWLPLSSSTILLLLLSLLPLMSSLLLTPMLLFVKTSLLTASFLLLLWSTLLMLLSDLGT